MTENYPKTAYILTLIGAIFALIIGIPLAIFGGFIATILPGAGIAIAVIALLGAILGIVAAMMMKDPQKVKTGGILAIIAAFFSVGGVISFVLLLVGGIMALTWKPPQPAPPPPAAAPPPPPPPM